MLTENGMQIDFDALNQLLERADVLTIGFSLFPERMLVDTRTGTGEGPLIATVGPVASVQERYLWLGQHRPAFGAPHAFSFFVWPHTVRALIEGDVLAPLRRRLEGAAPGGGQELDAALAQFALLECQAMRDAIQSEEGWATLWPRVA
jgi:hypothetical protein